MQEFAVGKRTRFLSYDEIAELGEAMRIAAAQGENRTALAAIKALALTGCRRREILDLPWDWLDNQRSRIGFADSKPGAQHRPIGEAAVSHPGRPSPTLLCRKSSPSTERPVADLRWINARRVDFASIIYVTYWDVGTVGHYVLPESCSIPCVEIQAEHEALVDLINSAFELPTSRSAYRRQIVSCPFRAAASSTLRAF